MTQIVPNYLYKMEFAFESDAAASFLVIKCNADVLEYQALMLEHNRIRHVIPADVVIKEGATCFYYNITSKISLSFFLKRRKFNREEFLRLLLHITAAVNDSAGYLLEDSNFIFNPEYIYISPETLEPALIYVPAPLEEGGRSQLQCFISDLVLMHINVDGFGSGNFVQRILASAKSEIFNIKGFIALLSELLYGQETEERDTGVEEPEIEETQDMWTLARNKKEEKQSKKIMEGRKVPWIPVLTVLIQIVMGIVIYMCRGFLNNLGDNPTATYAAVAMTVLAVEVLVFKKLSAAKLINLKSGQESSMIDEQKEIGRLRDTIESKPALGEKVVHKQSITTDYANAFERVYADTAGAVNEAAFEPAADSMNPINRSSGKTELLTSYTKGVRLLKSTGKQSDDKDIFIDKDDFIIGRLTGHVDFVLMNNAVGKLHVQLICKNSACYVKDLNSVNGTFINSKRIESNKEIELKNNDRLRLANSEFVFING